MCRPTSKSFKNVLKQAEQEVGLYILDKLLMQVNIFSRLVQSLDNLVVRMEDYIESFEREKIEVSSVNIPTMLLNSMREKEQALQELLAQVKGKRREQASTRLSEFEENLKRSREETLMAQEENEAKRIRISELSELNRTLTMRLNNMETIAHNFVLQFGPFTPGKLH